MDHLFQIYRLTAEDARKIAFSPDEPHCHDFEELIVGVEGELEHFIDFKSDNFVSPFISFVTKGKIHRVKPVINNNMFNVWVLEFRSEFIPETTFQLYSQYHDHANIKFPENENFDRMVILCEMMFNEMLKLFLIMLL